MKPAQHPLHEVKSRVWCIVRDSDHAKLAECLCGKHLPALGGQEHPADLVHRAVSCLPYDPTLPKRLAPLVAKLCIERAETLAAAALAADRLLDDEVYVFNLLLFASYLPTRESLFDALKTLHQAGQRTGPLLSGDSRAGRQLRQALIYHQTNNSLEEGWLALIQQSEERVGRLSTIRKTDLLDAWKGLLWIPPSPTEREAGNTLSVDRAVRGLLALHDAAGDSADGLSILRHAIRLLSEAYPRSPEFWADHIASQLEKWPELLREVAIEQWPLLATSEAERTEPMPASHGSGWDLPSQQEISEVAEPAGIYDKERHTLEEYPDVDPKRRK